MLYENTDQDIKITVCPIFINDHSEPEEQKFLWAFYVRVENLGSEPVQLVSRYWKIVDGLGHICEIQGEGVVGEQPFILPGQDFEYASSTPLSTPSGIMSGYYSMLKSSGEAFAVKTPVFSLDSPYHSKTLH